MSQDLELRKGMVEGSPGAEGSGPPAQEASPQTSPARKGTVLRAIDGPDSGQALPFRTPRATFSSTVLVRRLEQEVHAAALDHAYRFALILVELPESGGLEAEEEVGAGRHPFLTAVASQLRRLDLVCILGPQQVAIVLGDIAGSQDLGPVLERIQTCSSSSMQIMARPVATSARVGAVLGSYEFSHPGSVLAVAEVALSRARERMDGGQETYLESNLARLREERCIERETLVATQRGEFSLHYQPIIESITYRIVGFEALMRWTHPDRGPVSPATFIPILERSGLIHPMGAWAIEQACRDLARLQQLRDGKPLFMSVNISRQQMTRPGFAEETIDIIRQSGVHPSQLCLEITESLAMDEAGRVASAARTLRESGVLISIDDFGSGFSTFGALDQLPADTLKIDRSLIHEVSHSERRQAILKGVIRVGHALGLKLVAEGIEAPADMQSVSGMGCDQVQGFLFSRAIPLEQALALLTKEPPWLP